MAKSVDTEQFTTEIAASLDWQKGDAKRVLNAFIANLAKHLEARRSVSFMLLGTFSVRDDEDGFPKVTFNPSHLFKQKLGVRPEMNKYGVVLDQNKSMTAKLTGKCPDCGAELESKDPPKCPKCGTKPFEDQKGTDGK